MSSRRRRLDELREDLGGTAALREVIRSFLDQTPSVLSALRDAAARADVPSIRRAAHMIKGTNSTLGARELSEQCAEIERVGQTGCIADAGSRVIAVEASQPSRKWGGEVSKVLRRRRNR